MSISLVSVRNPKWKTKTSINDQNGDSYQSKVIECEAIWTTSEANVNLPTNWQVFTVSAQDESQHYIDLYNALVNGDHGAIAEE